MQKSARAKQAVRNPLWGTSEWVSGANEWTSKWPSTYEPILSCSEPCIASQSHHLSPWPLPRCSPRLEWWREKCPLDALHDYSRWCLGRPKRPRSQRLPDVKHLNLPRRQSVFGLRIHLWCLWESQLLDVSKWPGFVPQCIVCASSTHLYKRLCPSVVLLVRLFRVIFEQTLFLMKNLLMTLQKRNKGTTEQWLIHQLIQLSPLSTLLQCHKKTDF